VYRETREVIGRRRSEGCRAVEMEAAAFFAVARFRRVVLGQILYAGDDVGGETWRHRDWHRQVEVRSALLDLAVEACRRLPTATGLGSKLGQSSG
jgi:uridine phosphorylase